MTEPERISLAEVARRAGVKAATLRRWVDSGVIPAPADGVWTAAAISHARLVARMRERGHSLQQLREATATGRLAFGYIEDLLPPATSDYTLEEAAKETGLETALIEVFPDVDALELTRWRIDELALVVSPDHPLAGRTGLTIADLLDGSGLALEARGEYELKGLSGPRTIFALRR